MAMERKGEDAFGKRVDYWRAEHRRRKEEVTDGQKEKLITAFLKEICELSPGELRAFLLLSTDDGSEKMRGAREKINYWFNISKPFKEGKEFQGEYQEKRERLKKEAVTILRGVYAEGEIEEFFSLLSLGEEIYMVTELAFKHPLYTKIRDVYLPGMVDFLVGGVNMTKEVFSTNLFPSEIVDIITGRKGGLISLPTQTKN